MLGQFFRSRSPERSAFLFAVGSLLAALLMAVLFYHRESTAPELPRSELTLRDGRWFRTGSDTAFTGVMLETYETGVLKCRSELSNGLLQGLSQGWFTNGQCQIEEHFRAGVSHGQRTKWYPNGHKSSEANIVNGKLEGTFRRWDDGGRLCEEIQMRDGYPHGLSRAFYPSGCIKAEAWLECGAVREQKFWKDGERQDSTSLIKQYAKDEP